MVDLDAALGRGSNRSILETLVGMAPCRVGGGIRDAEAARRWLDAGAARVVLGTAAPNVAMTPSPRNLSMLPPRPWITGTTCAW